MAGSIGVLPDNWTFVKRRPRLEEQATLIVGDFENEMKICKSGEMIESRIFILGDTTFKIRVFPNGTNEENKNFVAIFLANYSDSEVNVSTEFEICNSKKLRWENKNVPAKGTWGFNKGLEKAALTTLLVDGALIVKVKAQMEQKDYVVIGKDKKNEESKSAEDIIAIHNNNIYKNMMNPDFVLTCEGENIECHRHFLVSASPMFAGMMESCMKEAEKRKTDIKCSFTVGKQLVRFIYTGKVEEDILVEHILEFLELGERLQMDTLKRFVEDKMLNNLNTENMSRFFVAGDRYGAGRIREKAKCLLKINLRKMKENTGWENEFGSKKELIVELWEDFI